MTDPWDKPSVGDGDEDPMITYAAVGRTITIWETFEFHLSILYSVFRRHPSGLTAVMEYGNQGRIFEDRIQALCRAAEDYFRSHPNQDHEGQFSEVVFHARKLSARRNEIAHGVVDRYYMPNPEAEDRRVSGWTITRFFLTSPIYAYLRKGGTYYFGSVELNNFGRVFGEAVVMARNLAWTLSQAASRRRP